MKIKAAAFAILFGFAGLASATQSGQTWTHSSGTFSITIVEGWIIADRAQNPEWFQEDFEFLTVEANASRPENLCYIILDSSAPAPMPASRERMNETTRSLEHSPVVERMRNNPQFRLDRVETPTVDGVATLDTYGGFESLETIQRRFFLHHSGMIGMYTLSCSVPGGKAQALEEARSIAASLRFHLAGTSP